MKRLLVLLLLVLTLMPVSGVQAEGETLHLYIIPIEQVDSTRGPEYFKWRFDANGPSIDCKWGLMDYGFINYGLLVAVNISDSDHATLLTHSDVYVFPANLDAKITDGQSISTFFEDINIPADWLTPSTSYRDLLRYTAGLFQFNQRYGGISGGHSVFEGGITLDSSWSALTSQQQSWFNQTIASFGYSFSVSGNPKLRTLAKQVGDLWGSAPFYLGGLEF